MIAELVKYPAPAGMTRDDVIADAQTVIAKWQAEPELLRKHFLWSDDGKWLVGFYLWKSRAAAERAHNSDWRAAVAERSGQAPEISYFDAVMTLDNMTGTVDIAA